MPNAEYSKYQFSNISWNGDGNRLLVATFICFCGWVLQAPKKKKNFSIPIDCYFHLKSAKKSEQQAKLSRIIFGLRLTTTQVYLSSFILLLEIRTSIQQLHRILRNSENGVKGQEIIAHKNTREKTKRFAYWYHNTISGNQTVIILLPLYFSFAIFRPRCGPLFRYWFVQYSICEMPKHLTVIYFGTNY